MTIELNFDQIELTKNMIKASIIRHREWIKYAKRRKATKEVEILKAMLADRLVFQEFINKATELDK